MLVIAGECWGPSATAGKYRRLLVYTGDIFASRDESGVFESAFFRKAHMIEFIGQIGLD